MRILIIISNMMYCTQLHIYISTKEERTGQPILHESVFRAFCHIKTGMKVTWILVTSTGYVGKGHTRAQGPGRQADSWHHEQGAGSQVKTPTKRL